MKHKKFNMLVFVSVFAVLFCITASNSTTMVEFSLKDLCVKSSDIIIARTVSVNSYLGPDQKRVFTEIRLEVSDTIKGRFQKEYLLKLTLYGGTVNGITTIIVGAPQFTLGEQSLLFLSEKQSAKSGQNYLTVVGMSQGKFNIFTDSETNEKKVLRDQIQVPLQLEKNVSWHLTLTNSQSMTLAIFLSYINAYLK